MKIIAKALVAAILVLALGGPLSSQQAPAKRTPAKPAPAQTPAPKRPAPEYKIADEIKLKGVVEQVKHYDCPVSGTVGTHLVVKVDSEKYEAHIGPQKFLEEYNINLKAGDTITLYATKVSLGPGPGLLVRAIERESDQFFFRDKEGLPLWR